MPTDDECFAPETCHRCGQTNCLGDCDEIALADTEPPPPWAGEFVLDRPEDLDDEARRIIVANLQAGRGG